MSRLYGAHKAIAAGRAAVDAANEACREAVRRFDAAKTVAEASQVMAWLKTQDFFLALSEERTTMDAAFERMRLRVQPPSKS